VLLLLVPAIYAGARTLDLPKDLRDPMRIAMLLAVIAQITLWVTAVVDER
jgi:hypothetical protein